jgi:hypothetical protein
MPDLDAISPEDFDHAEQALESALDAAPPPFKDLGSTPLAIQLGLTTEQLNGHWCSRCQGIWFGYTLETECPVCGNRNG